MPENHDENQDPKADGSDDAKGSEGAEGENTTEGKAPPAGPKPVTWKHLVFALIKAQATSQYNDRRSERQAGEIDGRMDDVESALRAMTPEARAAMAALVERLDNSSDAEEMEAVIVGGKLFPDGRIHCEIEGVQIRFAANGQITISEE